MKPLSLALILGALPAGLLPLAALADRIDMPAPVSQVTLYPQGASVTRQITLNAPLGQHQLVIPGLPLDTDPAALRIAAEGVTLGAVELQSERALPDHTPEPPAIATARDSLRRAEDALRDFDRSQQLLATRAEALRQRAQITRDLLQGDSRMDPDQIPAIVERMGTLIEDLLAQADEQEYQIAMRDPDRLPLQQAIDRARAEFEALQQADTGFATLVLDLEVTAEAPAQIAISGFTDAAGWQPDYDLRLDRAADTLTMQRGVSVWQASGEDWADVRLTLSTARPNSQTAPTEVPSWMPSYGRPETLLEPMAEARQALAYDAGGAEAVAAAPVGAPEMARMGVTVVYAYPGAVSIRNGADSLRLTLDEKALDPEILAEAAPRFDDRAYLVAETVNATGEPILPGPVTLYADGAQVGRSSVDLVAAGDKLRFGFGPIDGLRAEIRLPEESQGDRGLIRKSGTLHETALLIVENLTGEDWPLRIVDRVPVSRQEDLQVDWQADPEPSETDPDGRRGVLYWQDPIAAGETREITLTTDLSWPDGNELLR